MSPTPSSIPTTPAVHLPLGAATPQTNDIRFCFQQTEPFLQSDITACQSSSEQYGRRSKSWTNYHTSSSKTSSLKINKKNPTLKKM